ncbi:MAG: hypothetical protein IJ366_09950 [Clostridia bacterium]|nr:hypothetical protein [Clostridia bacterium]
MLILSIMTGLIPAAFAAGSYRSEANTDYIFSISGETETYTMLGGDAENGFYVLANDYYGTYAHGGVEFDFTNESSIAYWLNNGFLSSDNTLSANITKYIDTEHQWDEGIGGISLLSSTELDSYADIIGCSAEFNDTPAVTDVYWWLRDNSGSVSRPYICAAGDTPSVKTVAAASLRLVRPVFYLKAEFFENVKLDVFRTGKAVKSAIADTDKSNVLYSLLEKEILSDTQSSYVISMKANIMPDGYILTEPYFDVTVTADVGIKDGYYVTVTADGMSKVRKNINFNNSNVQKIKVYLPVFNAETTYTVKLYYDNILLGTYSEEILAMTDIANDGYITQGFVTHYSDSNYDVDETIELLDAVGATVIRDHPLWSTVESNENGGAGKYVWSDNFKKYVKGLDEKGIEMLYILCDNNELYGDSWNDIFDTPEEVNGFVAYAVETAKQFPTIKRFEILNEENDKHTVEQYVALINATGKALKAYDPSIRVSAGANYTGEPTENGTGVYGKDFLAQMVDTETYQYIDGISHHLYHIYYTGDSQLFIDETNYVRECVRDFGGWLDVELTETGFSPADEEMPNWGLSDELQAAEMIKRSVINDSLNMSFVTNYVLKDKAATTIEQFHFVDNNDTPLPAYYAMKNFYDVTKYAEFMGEIEVCDRVRGYWYRDNGKNTVVMWQKPDAASGNQSPKKENATVAKVTYNPNEHDIRVYDTVGDEISFDGTITLDAPKYVVGISEDTLKAAYAEKALERLSFYSNYLDDDTINSYCEEYAALCSNPTTEGVTALLDKLYTYGLTMIENNTAEDVVLSARLSDLNDICDEVSKLITLCSDAADNDITVTRSVYESFERIINDIDSTEVLYKNKPYAEGREILNDVLEFKGQTVFEPTSTDYAAVDIEGNIEISGTCEPREFVSAKLEKDGNTAFASYQMSDENGKYSFNTSLADCGDYTLTVYDGEAHTEILSYSKASVSDEQKLISAKNIQARGLLNWAEALMDTSLKNSDYLYLENVDFNVADNKIDFKFTYDYDGRYEDAPVILAASYVDGVLAGCEIMNTADGENNFKATIDCGSDAEIKVMLFEDMKTVKPLKRNYLLTY